MIVIPLKPKYKKIKAEMVKKYGAKKGGEVFNAWANKENLEVEAKSYFFTSTQFKSFNDEFVEGDFAVGTPDTYNDILTEHCLTDMVRQLKALPITIDDNHESFKDVPIGQRFRSFNPIAKIEDPRQDGIKIHVKAVLNKAHQRYEEIKSSIKNGFLHSFSFGYIATDFEYKSIAGIRHRVINALRLINGTFTGVPIQPDSMFSAVALKSLSDAEFDDNEIKSLIGGIIMSDEKEGTEDAKPEEAPAEKPAEVPAAPAEPAPETPAPAENKEVLSEIKGFRKELAEVKSLIEKKGEGDEGKKEGEDDKGTVEERMIALEAKSKEFGKILAKPQVKGVVEKGEATGAEAKSKGPIDLIR